MEDYDREVKERVDSRNALESFVYSVKQQLEDEDNGQFERLSDEDRDDIEDAVAEVLEWVEENQAAGASIFCFSELFELEASMSF